jgi:prepilin-type N-terminal cleavage/methylation domain-containing protein
MAASRHNRAVTLIEMLVVLGILVVLGGVVVTVTFRTENQSKENAVAGAFTVLKSALREYYEVRDTFPVQPDPNSTQAAAHVRFLMKELLDEPASRQVLEKLSPALVKTATAGVPDLRDPWGTTFDYIYIRDDVNPRRSESFPELISAGPDKKFGTPDDISSKGRRRGG